MLNIFKKHIQKMNVHLGDCSVEKTEEKNLEACIFIGRSGCGKGTQVDLYIKKLQEINGFKTLHIETGSLLRQFVKTVSYTAELTKNIIYSGGLMPESIVIGLWTGYLMANFSGKENMVFDGAPRRLQEAVMLDGTLKFYNISKYKVVHINTSVKWCTERLLARGRKDDTKEGIEKRMEWFDNDVVPCIEFFKNNPNCVFIDINGEQTIEQVHNEIMKKVF